jgi:hypothetical protein
MSRERRQRQLREIDEWLQRLHTEHPILFDLLAVGIGSVLFWFVMLLRWLLQF